MYCSVDGVNVCAPFSLSSSSSASSSQSYIHLYMHLHNQIETTISHFQFAVFFTRPVVPFFVCHWFSVCLSVWQSAPLERTAAHHYQYHLFAWFSLFLFSAAFVLPAWCGAAFLTTTNSFIHSFWFWFSSIFGFGILFLFFPLLHYPLSCCSAYSPFTYPHYPHYTFPPFQLHVIWLSSRYQGCRVVLTFSPFFCCLVRLLMSAMFAHFQSSRIHRRTHTDTPTRQYTHTHIIQHSCPCFALHLCILIHSLAFISIHLPVVMFHFIHFAARFTDCAMCVCVCVWAENRQFLKSALFKCVLRWKPLIQAKFTSAACQISVVHMGMRESERL